MSLAFARADAAAAAVGARDLFVLRRVSGSRFVHLGGSGRGAGWAGLVEVSSDEEGSLAEALETRQPIRRAHERPERIFGPYYAFAAAVVPVTADLVVVFGSPDGPLGGAPDGELQAAAVQAADAVQAVTPAKRLADELEEVEAVRRVAEIDTGDPRRAMRSVASIAAGALSCELAAAYLADGDRLELVDPGDLLGVPGAEVAAALAGVLERQRFPFCVQDAAVVPPPPALAAGGAVRSYYMLELKGAPGILFVAHTDAAPRGFTLLCRRLGLRIAETGGAQLALALTRAWCRAEGERLESELGKLGST